MAPVLDAVVASSVLASLIAGGACLYINMSIENKIKGFEVRMWKEINDTYLKRLEWLVSQAADAARMNRMEQRMDSGERG